MSSDRVHLCKSEGAQGVALARKCSSGRSNMSQHGGRQLQLQSIQNRARQPVLWVPPTAPESAIERTRSGAEQRARSTAVAILAAAQAHPEWFTSSGQRSS